MADQPLAYIGSPMSGLTTEQDAMVKAWLIRSAVIANQAGYRVDMPFMREKPLDIDAHAAEKVCSQEQRILQDVDILVFLSLLPSTGGGMILRMAQDLFIPLVVVRPESVALSRMVKGALHNRSMEIVVTAFETLDANLYKVLLNARQGMGRKRADRPTNSLLRQIGRNIENARARSGYSRKSLSERLGTITDQEIADVEQGAIDPGVLRLHAIAIGLEVDVLTLMDSTIRTHGKEDESASIVNFFVRHDLGMGKFQTFLAAYESRGEKTFSRPLTDDELWKIYFELFPSAG